MSYYVSHMTPHKRARVHDGSCVHCRDGAGQANQQKSGSGAMGWSQPFETLEQAEAYMERQFTHFTDKGRCKHCLSEAT
jgi:hypothetical protein